MTLITKHTLEGATISIEDNLLQSRNVYNSPRRADCPILRPNSSKLSTLWLSSTTSQEELCTMSNLQLDAWLKRCWYSKYHRDRNSMNPSASTGVVCHKGPSTSSTTPNVNCLWWCCHRQHGGKGASASRRYQRVGLKVRRSSVPLDCESNDHRKGAWSEEPNTIERLR